MSVLVVAAAMAAATAAADLDARFEKREGWIGADGIYSVELGGGRVAWLFSDTWTGRIAEGRRHEPRMINNSVGITEGAGKATFFCGRDAEGRTAALFAPPDGRGWYWLWAGVMDGEGLGLFAARVEKTGGGGAFGFRLTGTALGSVENPNDAPDRWRVAWRDVPEAWGATRAWGSAAMRHDGFSYVYGYRENGEKGLAFQRWMTVARVPEGKLFDFGAWRFYGDGAWHEAAEKAEGICGSVATEYSVTWLAEKKCFLLVTHDMFLSPVIVARTAPTPWGPWSDKTEIYRCPENSAERGVFCYAGKHHPCYSDAKTLAVSYATNAHDMRTVLDDASLYMPRFVRVPLTKVMHD